MSQSPLTPDPIAVIEALRGFRYLVRRGGRDLESAIVSHAVPEPVTGLARTILSDLRKVAERVDQAASRAVAVARHDGDLTTATLEHLRFAADGSEVFGSSAYRAVKQILGVLKSEALFVSEATARRVFRASVGHDDRHTVDADLALALVEQEFVRGLRQDGGGPMQAGSLAGVACFALILWFKAVRQPSDNRDALLGAAALAAAIAEPVADALVRRDAAALQALLDKYAEHV